MYYRVWTISRLETNLFRRERIKGTDLLDTKDEDRTTQLGNLKKAIFI